MLRIIDDYDPDTSAEESIRGGTEQGGIPDGKKVPAAPVPKDIVDEASMESFPASDAPSWTPTTALGPPPS